MKLLNELLIERKTKLNKVITKCRMNLAQSPKGNLRVSTVNGYPRYYFKPKKRGSKSKYVRKSDMSIAIKIAQRDYYNTVLKSAANELEAIDSLLSLMSSGLFEDLYAKLIPGRKAIVTPITMTNEEYAKRWQTAPYEGKRFLPGDPDYRSLKDERMRSKSEVIIANLLDALGIPYRYEYPVKLANGNTIYVDFLLLNINTREEFAYEHMGKMGDEDYAAKNVTRLNDLMSSGYFPGENLLLSFESLDNPLDIKAVETMLRHFLM